MRGLSYTIERSARLNFHSVERTKFRAVDFSHPRVKALRTEGNRVLARYGLSESSPKLDIARAFRDWIARTRVHPHPPLHPTGYLRNMTALPAGASWQEFNTKMNATYVNEAGVTVNRANVDNDFWGANFYLDGIRLAEFSLGALNEATGEFDGTGQLERVDSGRWRIKSLDPAHPNYFRSMQCSWQHIELAHWLAAYGIPGTIVSTVGHDGFFCYVPNMGWVYQCSTYNEEQVLDGGGDPLSPLTQHLLATAGQRSRLGPRKTAGPDYDPEPYITPNFATDNTYYSNVGHAKGMITMGTMMGIGGNIGAPINTQRANHVHVLGEGTQSAGNEVFTNGDGYYRVQARTAFPELGVGIAGVQRLEAGINFTLFSTWPGPGTQRMYKRVNGGTWTELLFKLPDGRWADSLGAGVGTVEYRAIDSEGFYGDDAVISLPSSIYP